MKQYVVTGMTCAACQARVEKAVSKVKGVNECSVSLLTNTLNVSGDIDDTLIINAVEKAGYKVEQNKDKEENAYAGLLEDTVTPVLKKRLVASIIFLVALIYISMGHNMLSLPIFPFLENNPFALGLSEMILAAIIMIINQRFFISGFKGLINLSPNMDTLVAMGSFVSFAYSVVCLFKISNLMIDNQPTAANALVMNLYFESAAMILTLITVGKMLEARSKGKTTNALKALIQLKPTNATKIVDDKEIIVPSSQIRTSDILSVKPGEVIPVDGIIIKGFSSVDESSLSGESVPVEKEINSEVYSGTINQTGHILIKATKVGEDMTISNIIKLVGEAAATKAPIAKIADKVSGVFVPVVLGISLITFIIWMLLGEEIGESLARAISVLVISCPCSLGLATPVAIMVGNGVGAKQGIFYKNSTALEYAGKIDIVCVDKTGTITKGTPSVISLFSTNAYSDSDLLRYAYSIERYSEHPFAKAIIDYASKIGISPIDVDGFKALPGNGIVAHSSQGVIRAGNDKLISEFADVTIVKELADKTKNEGLTPLYFSIDNQLIGFINVSDEIRTDSKEAIEELKNLGLKVAMITGDNELTANAIANKAGIDTVYAGVLPNEKGSLINKLKNDGKVMMVGDGINDAVALTAADIGVAIGSGTDVAIDAADIVLMKNTLKDVSALIRLSRRTKINIYENYFWAFIYNILLIPLAAGAFVGFLHFRINPMLCALAMSLSSFFVVSNALRLNLIDIYDNKHDKPKKRKKNIDTIETEVLEMKKTMTIEGMMCAHCEARVKKTLEAIEGVKEAVVSYEEGTAIVYLDSDVSNDILKSAVEAQDYPVKEIL